MAKVLFLLLSLCCISWIDGLNIKEIIGERVELAVLKEYMKDLNFFKNDLGSDGPKKYTFFAPNNSAFYNIPGQKQSRYHGGHLTQVAKEELENIFSYHAAFNFDYVNDIYVTYRVEEMSNLKVSTSADGPPNLFFRTVGNDYFVNGAKLLPSDAQNIVADNGMVHIIDTFLYEPGKTISALKYIKEHTSGTDKSTTFRYFLEFLTEYEKQMGLHYNGVHHAENVLNGLAPMTLFLPSDEALEKMKPDKRQSLKNDFTNLKRVVESHVIKDGAYHTSILSLVSNVTAMEGKVQARSYLNKVDVSNNCAKGSITTANVTVFNGVVHVLNGLLGYVYSDIWDALDGYQGNLLQDFFLLVRGVTAVEELIDIPDTTINVPDSRLYTMFAPVNTGIENANFYGNAAEEERIVKMHMLHGRLELSAMTAAKEHVPTLQGQPARFFQKDNDGTLETYVQVNYVRSKIIDEDICVKNGIVHVTDHIVGLPTMTIMEYIERNNDFQSLYRSIRETGMDTVLKDENRVQTFLAPTNKAFDLMSETSQGSKLLDIDNTRYLRNVFHRQLVSAVYIFDQISGSSQDVTTDFNNEQITIVKEGPNYYVSFAQRRIPVKMADIRMKNGMLHVIDDVLYSDNPGASEWISAGSHVTPAYLLYYLLVSSVVFLATCIY